ncbi:MAG: glutathione S-transferase family protein [Myxococcales bacterium]
MAQVTLFSARACPYAHRTRLVLSAKQVEFELKEIDLRNKPAWFDRAVSGYGKVPAIEHGGRRIWESAIINEYLDEVFPETALLPREPGERARARILIDYANTRFTPAFGAVLRAQDDSELARASRELREALVFLEEQLARHATPGPFFLGATPSLVDFTLYPWFERWPALEYHRGASIPSELGLLSRWREAAAILPAVKTHENPVTFYIERYRSYVGSTHRLQ